MPRVPSRETPLSVPKITVASSGVRNTPAVYVIQQSIELVYIACIIICMYLIQYYI